MENISPHITYAEATKSATAMRYGKENIPNAKELEAMKWLAKQVFEPVRDHFKKPIAITSFFRSRSVNVLVGGAMEPTSQHCKGEAMDMDADVLGGVSNADIFHFIKNNLEFDQLIWEFGNEISPDWIHVSYKVTGNRKQIVRSVKNGYKAIYKRWE